MTIGAETQKNLIIIEICGTEYLQILQIIEETIKDVIGLLIGCYMRYDVNAEMKRSRAKQ